MFNAEFYPTPAPIAAAMAAALRRDRTLDELYPVLDPSAGKGDLLKEFKPDRASKYYGKIAAIEINPDLAALLKGSGIKVIGSDFLKFNEIESWNSIIMNPPFSVGIKHLFHAWQCLKPGGRVVCLLPDTTRTTNNQKLQQMIDLYGYSVPIGACFEDAERKTRVPILAIVLDKPKPKFDVNFTFSADNFAEEMFETAIATGTGKVDTIKSLVHSLVHQYELAQEAIREQAIACSKLEFALQGIKTLSTREKYTYDQKELAEFCFERAIAELKQLFWEVVFIKTELRKRCTQDFIKKFDEFQKEQQNMAFNEENIKSLLLMFYENREQIHIDAVCYIFDKLTSHHKKNVTRAAGWKTNKAARLNDRIILPAWDAYGSRNYETESILEDLDKICCTISGVPIDSLKETIKQNVYGDKTYGEAESFFFWIKTFKCGSVHLKFKDKQICEEINKVVAKERKWIGSDYPTTKGKEKKSVSKPKKEKNGFHCEFHCDRRYALDEVSPWVNDRLTIVFNRIDDYPQEYRHRNRMAKGLKSWKYQQKYRLTAIDIEKIDYVIECLS